MKEIINQLGMYNLRSRAHTLLHPFSRSYDLAGALEEMKPIQEIQNEFFRDEFGFEYLKSERKVSNVGLQEMIHKIQILRI